MTGSTEEGGMSRERTLYCAGCPLWAQGENGPDGAYGPDKHPLTLGDLGTHEWQPVYELEVAAALFSGDYDDLTVKALRELMENRARLKAEDDDTQGPWRRGERL